MSPYLKLFSSCFAINELVYWNKGVTSGKVLLIGSAWHRDSFQDGLKLLTAGWLKSISTLFCSVYHHTHLAHTQPEYPFDPEPQYLCAAPHWPVTWKKKIRPRSKSKHPLKRLNPVTCMKYSQKRLVEVDVLSVALIKRLTHKPKQTIIWLSYCYIHDNCNTWEFQNFFISCYANVEGSIPLIFFQCLWC